MSQLSINEEEFLSWKSHPVTQVLMEHVNQLREDMKESFANGGIESGRESFHVGACMAYATVMMTRYEDFIERKEREHESR